MILLRFEEIDLATGESVYSFAPRSWWWCNQVRDYVRAHRDIKPFGGTLPGITVLYTHYEYEYGTSTSIRSRAGAPRRLDALGRGAGGGLF